VSALPSPAGADRLRALERALVRNANHLALFLVYDRPEREGERAGLWRTYFAQRCVSDQQLEVTVNAFRSVGAYVELFAGERAWISALAEGRLQRLPQPMKAAFNGIGWGVGVDGFMPGRKALVPLLADAYGITCINSDAHACAVTVHKFHSSLVIDGLGIRAPRTWHYRPPHGWVGGVPAQGTRVIAKSTFEAWSVGVTDGSVFMVDDTLDARVGAVAESIGQAVTVQEFISGREVYVPVFSCPERIVTPPMEALAAKAPGDPDTVMTIEDSLRGGGVCFRPFEASADLMENLGRTAIKVLDIFDMYGLARIDFRIDDADQLWVFDIAIDPGVAIENSAFQSLAHFGFDHGAFLRTVVAATLSAKGLLRA
jgi:D-alanine-D-alanine ligase